MHAFALARGENDDRNRHLSEPLRALEPAIIACRASRHLLNASRPRFIVEFRLATRPSLGDFE
jgi:hypothetical protein